MSTKHQEVRFVPPALGISFSGLVSNSIKITLSTTKLKPASILEEAPGRSLPAQKTVVIKIGGSVLVHH